MPHFYELLENRIISPGDEIERLNTLFYRETTIDIVESRSYLSFQNFIDLRVFRKFDANFRLTFLNVDDMMVSFDLHRNDESIEGLFLYSEFILGIIDKGWDEIKNVETARKQALLIYGNIKSFAEKTNHEISAIEGGQRIIVEKNKLTSQAVEQIKDEDIAFATIEYNHTKLKGNLDKKRSILRSLGQYIEPLLKSRKLANNGYAGLESDVGFLLNNFHIRHNNKEGNNANKYIASIDDATLEGWYDKAYNMMLSAIIMEKNIDVCEELTELKSKHWK